MLLKPNLVEYEPKSAINTHPLLVHAVYEGFRALGAASVRIAEGPGHRRDTLDLADAAGYFEAVPRFEDAFVDLNLDDVSRVRLSQPAFRRMQEWYLPKTALGADLLVSLPKMKTHHWAGVTLAMKNLFGVVPSGVYGWPKNTLHWSGINECIADLRTLFPRQFALVDGIVGMEGNGPIQGSPKPAGVLVAGSDPAAVDATCCRIMGIDPLKLPYLALAAGPQLPDSRGGYPADRRARLRRGHAVRVAASIPARPFGSELVEMALPHRDAHTPESLGARFLRSRLPWPILSVALLAPCYWQPRIQAGDLSSHIYNSWLARLVENGHAQGLRLASQSTNVLFDLILGALFRTLGAEAAQRIAVSLCALVFIWGAFAFVSAASGRRAWNLLPCIAMLAYGWVFHMGFFNFYLALGLCFWAMALAWRPSPRKLAGAVVLLSVAYVAHALPVLWMAGLMGYVVLARRRSPAFRAWLTLGFLAAMGALSLAASHAFIARWYPAQIASLGGADQVWVYDAKYAPLWIGLICIWAALFANLIRALGPRRVFSGIPFQLLVITAAGILIAPSSVLLPGFQHSLAYISERMSLAVAVSVCALLGAARPGRSGLAAMAVLAAVFFSFLYSDERALNRFEDRMRDAVARLEPGDRVVSVVTTDDLRVNAVTHMIDRVCVEHCYSFANYEPVTRQFRVRVCAASPIVVSSYADSWALQTGTYTVRPADEPLYAVDVDPSGHLSVRRLLSGTLCGSTSWKVLTPIIPAI